MNISISKIKNTGRVIRRTIRDGGKVPTEELERLQHYRIAYQVALQKTFKAVVSASKIHYKGSLTVYRLKRIDTINRKLFQ